MKNPPDSLTLEELLDIISKEMEGIPSEKITEKLIITIGILKDVYDIDDNANNYTSCIQLQGLKNNATREL